MSEAINDADIQNAIECLHEVITSIYESVKIDPTKLDEDFILGMLDIGRHAKTLAKFYLLLHEPPDIVRNLLEERLTSAGDKGDD